MQWRNMLTEKVIKIWLFTKVINKMQIITHEKPNIHPIFDEFDRLYSVTSEKRPKQSLIKNEFNVIFSPLIDLFNEKVQNYAEIIKLVNKPITVATTPQNKPKTIIICFSGGKDSTAVIQYYKEKGYNIYLYHMRHINSALTDEYIQAQDIANYFNVPLYIDTIKLSGHHDYVEHPMKNMIIANGALQYGIRENIGTNIAFGNYNTSSLEYDNFEFCGGDDMEMWDVYNSIISHIIPQFKMNIILTNLNDTFERVCNNKELLEKTISCIGRANLRKHKHDWVKAKYGIDLPKYRCGQCYKCCVEYIYMTDHNLQDYSADYYEYCLKKLKQNVEAEDNKKYTEAEVFQHYLFYGMEKSKYYGKYRNTTGKYGKTI